MIKPTYHDHTITFSSPDITSSIDGCRSLYPKVPEEVWKVFEKYCFNGNAHIRNHSLRMASFCDIVAAAFVEFNIDPEILRIGTLLHDTGKHFIPDSILLKPNFLTEDEWSSYMIQHPQWGYDVLKKHFDHQLPQDVLDMTLFHQIWYDGNPRRSYPYELIGKDIPLYAQIVSMMDTLDALIAPKAERPYRDPVNIGKALEIIAEGSGTQFNPDLVPIFIECFSPKESV